MTIFRGGAVQIPPSPYRRYQTVFSFFGESNKNPRLCRGNQGALASGKKPPML